MTQDDFAKQMEKAFRDALKQADAITANAELVRKQAKAELDAAREARRIAESTGEQMANEYYEGKRKEFIEAARIGLMRNLARKHIETGKTNHDISLWLDVEQGFCAKNTGRGGASRKIPGRKTQTHSLRRQSQGHF